jgi:hypothetical protein
MITAFICLILCPSAPPQSAWQATRTLAAPEAHQAAAADVKFVYAITNDKVAKYDRESGEKVGESTGEAQHLNSGFLHEGKLFLAHSNYPRTPEESKLMVLDLKTLKLTAHHDFGNFGGSLTWAIFHDGHWWCNFARYGVNNAETFLVKFDSNWKEVARWTYPQDLIAKLGGNSLSGGIWYDEKLLVTGHDDPVVFQVRVPERGDVLELVGERKVPFTGQGIAVDPKTGGLVGINRKRRQIIFATLQESEAQP